MNYRNRKRGIVLYVVIAFIILVLSLFTVYDLFFRKWDAEKILPKQADNIKVKVFESFNPFVSDFIYILKAQITKDEFENVKSQFASSSSGWGRR